MAVVSFSDGKHSQAWQQVTPWFCIPAPYGSSKAHVQSCLYPITLITVEHNLCAWQGCYSAVILPFSDREYVQSDALVLLTGTIRFSLVETRLQLLACNDPLTTSGIPTRYVHVCDIALTASLSDHKYTGRHSTGNAPVDQVHMVRRDAPAILFIKQVSHNK